MSKPIRLTKSISMAQCGRLEPGTVIIPEPHGEAVQTRLVNMGYAQEVELHYLTEEQYQALVNPARQADGVPCDEDFASEEEPNDDDNERATGFNSSDEG